jgi:hypothetical protein
MNVDFAKLGSGTTIARQVWVANVEMAISAAKVARDNFCTQETLLLLQMPKLKTSSHLRNKEVRFHIPSMHIGIGTPTLKQPIYHDTVSLSPLFSFLQVSILLLMTSSSSFPTIKTTVSSSRAYPSTP